MIMIYCKNIQYAVIPFESIRPDVLPASRRSCVPPAFQRSSCHRCASLYWHSLPRLLRPRHLRLLLGPSLRCPCCRCCFRSCCVVSHDECDDGYGDDGDCDDHRHVYLCCHNSTRVASSRASWTTLLMTDASR